MVRKNPSVVPESPPTSVKRRTLESGRSTSSVSRISWTGTGVYTVRSR